MNSRPSWDAEVFTRKYDYIMEKIRNGERDLYYRIKLLRADEFQNTVKIVNSRSYIDGMKTVHNFADKIVSQFYHEPFTVDHISVYHDTDIKVLNEDCLHTAERLVRSGYNPAVLNMASRSTPGGGVINGAGAQEETIFRRTDLFRSLYQFASFGHMYGVEVSNRQYPLDRNYGGIYSSNVTVFREDEKHGYALMEKPFRTSFISVAGMNRPALDSNGMIQSYLIEGVRNKIRTILRIGLEKGHDSLVLGALGCGAFRNPPRHIARLFHEVLEEKEFGNKFRLIVFSILEDHNSRRAHNPEGNYKPFHDEFKR